MNILTFDIEEWYIELSRFGEAGRFSDYDRYLEDILNLLDEQDIKATFFCVGMMGQLFPHVVRKICANGHEIGCHSNVHTWLNKMNERECREDTHVAVDSLEQCIGQKIHSYRAPAFSIGADNLWTFEILAENGIERDASIFPASRDFGGFPNFGQQKPTIIHYRGIELKEFPIAMTNVMGKSIAYSGGGYFRFFPLNYIKNRIDKSDYVMCYFHIGDLIPETNKFRSKESYEDYYRERGTLKAGCMRYIKGNLGKKNAFDKMKQLVRTVRFINLEETDRTIEWVDAPSIYL